jgi:hypothetical protein
LFWRAWASTFKEKLILKSFEFTGIWLMERDVIPERFCLKTPGEADQFKLYSTCRKRLEAYKNLGRGYNKRGGRKECKEDHSFILLSAGAK